MTSQKQPSRDPRQAGRNVNDDPTRGQDPRNVRPTPGPPARPGYKSTPAQRASVETHLRRLLPSHRVRQDGLWPYLLIRSQVGDNGRRPYSGPFWESPDILIIPGNVQNANQGTPTLQPHAGQPHTIFVHVWNLGRLAAIGVKLSVNVASSIYYPGDPRHLTVDFIGATYFDLPDHRDPNCHNLIRLPALYTPTYNGASASGVVARVECLMDLGGVLFHTNTNRHEAQRSITVQP